MQRRRKGTICFKHANRRGSECGVNLSTYTRHYARLGWLGNICGCQEASRGAVAGVREELASLCSIFPAYFTLTKQCPPGVATRPESGQGQSGLAISDRLRVVPGRRGARGSHGRAFMSLGYAPGLQESSYSAHLFEEGQVIDRYCAGGFPPIRYLPLLRVTAVRILGPHSSRIEPNGFKLYPEVARRCND